MKRILTLAALAVALPLAGQEAGTARDWNIKASELHGYVEELASDKYGGRLTGSEGYRLAANWLADRFRESGLKPGVGKGWFQEFPQPWVEVLKGGSLKVGREYHYFDEFMPGSTSDSGDLTAEVVFAGYGITAPELSYDDYADVDVRGRIVLIRPEAPVSPSAGAETFLPWLSYSTHQYKMANAISHGAAGVLYHYGPLANTNNEFHPGLILVMVGQKVVNDLFEGTGRSYEAVVKSIAEQRKPASFPTGKKARLSVRTVWHPDGTGMNVVGMIPGSDPVLKDEIILIGGHLDHCGQCWDVCPGANDNASGIAVIAGLADALARSGLSFARTIVFVGFGSEEQGLRGSLHFLAHPLFPTNRIKCFLNLDCVGIGPNLHAGGGENHPEWFGIISEANRLTVNRTLTASFDANLGRPRSDAAVFRKESVPAISFSSYGASGAYHTPDDKASAIWPETLEALATILAGAVSRMAGIVR